MLPERVETESEKLTTYLTVKLELHGSPWIAVDRRDAYYAVDSNVPVCVASHNRSPTVGCARFGKKRKKKTAFLHQ
jgi:hypothetical protein